MTVTLVLRRQGAYNPLFDPTARCVRLRSRTIGVR